MSDVFVRPKQKRQAGVTAETLIIALLFALVVLCEAIGIVGSMLASAWQRRRWRAARMPSRE